MTISDFSARRSARRAVKHAFPDAAITFAPAASTGLIITAIVSRAFEGLDQPARQQQVWDALNSLQWQHRHRLSGVLTVTPEESARCSDFSDQLAASLSWRRKLVRKAPWDIDQLKSGGHGFIVGNGRIEMARWVFDTAVPWVLCAEHPGGAAAWKTATVLPTDPQRASESSPAGDQEIEVLFRTPEFFAALDELDTLSGGLCAWQLDQKPEFRLGLSSCLFSDSRDANYQEQGVRLAILLPHENAVASVTGPHQSDVWASWRRGMAINDEADRRL